ncbi:MAG TPA: hypothetical protein VEK34_06690 [Methylocella sp.]|nr:hypothetical protein [Methylocella sp.]
MVKLMQERGSLTRAMIAIILAWLLAFQGFAFAASPQKPFTPVGSGAGHAVSSGDDYCGTPRGGGSPAPCRDDHCQCCITRAPMDGGEVGGIAAILPDAAFVSPRRTTGVISSHIPSSETKPPAGWTSSWSQRAPPRFS